MTLPKNYMRKEGKIRYTKTTGKILLAIGGLLLIPLILNGPTPYNLLALPMVIAGITLLAIYKIKTTAHSFTGGYKLGDPLAEGTRSLIYGLGILFLVLGVIVAIAGIIAVFSSPSNSLSWWWVSPLLLVVGFIMKLVGTKIDHLDNGGGSIESSRLEHKP